MNPKTMLKIATINLLATLTILGYQTIPNAQAGLLSSISALHHMTGIAKDTKQIVSRPKKKHAESKPTDEQILQADYKADQAELDLDPCTTPDHNAYAAHQ